MSTFFCVKKRKEKYSTISQRESTFFTSIQGQILAWKQLPFSTMVKIMLKFHKIWTKLWNNIVLAKFFACRSFRCWMIICKTSLPDQSSFWFSYLSFRRHDIKAGLGLRPLSVKTTTSFWRNNTRERSVTASVDFT